MEPEVLNTSETLALINKGDLEKILKEERNIMSTILRQRKTEEVYRLQTNRLQRQHKNCRTRQGTSEIADLHLTDISADLTQKG